MRFAFTALDLKNSLIMQYLKFVGFGVLSLLLAACGTSSGFSSMATRILGEFIMASKTRLPSQNVRYSILTTFVFLPILVNLGACPQ